jgi:NADPH:quinone reductase-like Zn-dependent oxidoreductase
MMNATTHLSTGGYAELAAVDLTDCAPVTDDVDLLEATAVLHDGTTALRLLEKTAPKEGEWILILGAAGGMGLLLVQLLANRRAKVVGAASGSTKREVVSEAGAVAAIDYGDPGWTDAVLDASGGCRPTVVLDGVGGRLAGRAFRLIADGGRFLAHGTRAARSHRSTGVRRSAVASPSQPSPTSNTARATGLGCSPPFSARSAPDRWPPSWVRPSHWLRHEGSSGN